MSVIDQVDAAVQFPLKLRVNLEKELGLFGVIRILIDTCKQGTFLTKNLT